VKSLADHTGEVSSVAFSGDSHFLATASWDGTAFVYYCGMLGLPIQIETPNANVNNDQNARDLILNQKRNNLKKYCDNNEINY